MNDNTESTERGWVWRVVWVALLLVAYPLSMGPAAWVIVKTDPTGEGWVNAIATQFYMPVHFVAATLGVQETLFAYIRWFAELA